MVSDCMNRVGGGISEEYEREVFISVSEKIHLNDCFCED